MVDQTILWAVVLISLLTFVKTLLDALNKTAEAEEAHARHYKKEVEAPKDPPRSRSPKENVDFASFMIGFLASFLGLIFAGAKAGNLPVAMMIWGLGLIVALFSVAWASWYYARPSQSKIANFLSKPLAWVSSVLFNRKAEPEPAIGEEGSTPSGALPSDANVVP